MTEEYTTTDDQLRAAFRRVVGEPVKTLDVPILAEALNNTVGTSGWLRATPSDPVEEWLVNAELIAREYARLVANPATSSELGLRDAVIRYVVAATRSAVGHASDDDVEAAYAAMVDALSAGPGSQSAGK
jgi:hypothetical protein